MVYTIMPAMLKITLVISCLGFYNSVTRAHALEAATSTRHDDLLLQLRAMLLEDVLTRMDEFRNISDEKHRALQSHLSQIDIKLSSHNDNVGTIETQVIENLQDWQHKFMLQVDTKHDDLLLQLRSMLSDEKNCTQDVITRIDEFRNISDEKNETIESTLSQIDTKLSSHNDTLSTVETQVQDIKTILKVANRSLQNESSPKPRFLESDYVVHNSKKTWSSAKDYCIARGQRLVSLQTIEEGEFIKGLPSVLRHRAICNGRHGKGEFWTGGKKTSDGWFWDSTSERVPEILQWEASEPSGNGHCLQYRSWIDGLLDDYQCSGQKCFICEK